jgi:hypothetical protein
MVLFVISLEVSVQVNLCGDVQDQSTKTITTEASEKKPNIKASRAVSSLGKVYTIFRD